MFNKKRFTGFAIAIAWPQTYCKQPGSWYDEILNSLGISENHYYKIGHAALVLIDSQNMDCHYFDFGRYHTPFQHGRVRNASTDHRLAIKTIPVISKGGKKLDNLQDLLTELQLNEECHGEGELHASYCRIDFHKTVKKVNELQQKSPIPYGPFIYNGSNCSRFVNTTIVSGKPNWISLFKLKYLVPFTPKPINNVNSLSNKVLLPKKLSNVAFRPIMISDKRILKSLLPQPVRHADIPENAQWLSGEGAGSWFNIKPDKGKYLISRYNQDGVLECEGKFELSKNSIFNKNLPFQFIHLSTCNKNKIQQNNKVIEFTRI